MKFTREAIITRTAGPGLDANGNPHTVPAVTQTPLSDLVLGDGVASKTVFKRTQTFGLSRETESILTLDVVVGSWLDIIQPINGSNQVFITANVVDLGAMSGLLCRIEFQDPDHPEFWIPSKENINRESAASDHSWSLIQTGNYVLASRQEHRHFRAFRARFQALVADADTDTHIVVSWHHAGGISAPEDEANDPDAPLN